MHGGLSLKGPASPTFKDGRYSKYMPRGIADKYRRSLEDGELLRLRHEIALIGARTQELLAGMTSDDGLTRWKRLKAAHDSMTRARESKDMARLEQALTDIGSLIADGSKEQEAWDEITKMVEVRRKLVDSEMAHIIKMEYMLTAEAAMMWIMRIGDIIKRHVSDRAALSNIHQELGKLVDIDALRLPLTTGPTGEG